MLTSCFHEQKICKDKKFCNLFLDKYEKKDYWEYGISGSNLYVI
ncbi:unnamed protein product [Tenebrio molitor]|nr:unnamed protein product [Tenebrio molitor]